MIETAEGVLAPRRKLWQRPWLAAPLFILVWLVVQALTLVVVYGVLRMPRESPYAQTLASVTGHVLALLVLTPFVLHLPSGGRTLRQYTRDIRLTWGQPLGRLLWLALSCYAILAICQALGSVVYRLTTGLPVTWAFLRAHVFDLSGDLPPASAGMLVSLPSVFEEVAFRGIVLQLFAARTTPRKAILWSSLGIGLLHVLNLTSGHSFAWVAGQVVWATTLGLFYGALTVRSGSIIPAMIVHYLGNLFVGSLTGYIMMVASPQTKALYGVVFTFGVIPTTLLLLWVRRLTASQPTYLVQKEAQV